MKHYLASVLPGAQVCTKGQTVFVLVFMKYVVRTALATGHCSKSMTMVVVFDSEFIFWNSAFGIKNPYHKMLGCDNFIFLLGCCDLLGCTLLGPLRIKSTESCAKCSALSLQTEIGLCYLGCWPLENRASESLLAAPGTILRPSLPVCWLLVLNVHLVL